MEQCECSVVVVQYNSMWDKVKRTLNSIINQKDCNFEIVIADDGSKDTLFDEIEKYFKEKQFLKYQFVENMQNVGTVKNIISGIEVATGKYVRVIAPGDMLYSDTTLRRIVEFMNQNNAKEVFGRMAFFEYKDDRIDVLPLQVPFDVGPYQRHDIRNIKKHLLVLGDNISGASYTWDREYYLECLMRISGQVVYLEDCVNAYTVYDKHEIYFIDEFVTWYEHGTGISTSKNKKWTTLLIKDWLSFLKEMDRRYPNDTYKKKAYLYYHMSERGVIFNKIIKNLLFLTRYLYNCFMSKRVEYTVQEQIDKKNIEKYY